MINKVLNTGYTNKNLTGRTIIQKQNSNRVSFSGSSALKAVAVPAVLLLAYMAAGRPESHEKTCDHAVDTINEKTGANLGYTRAPDVSKTSDKCFSTIEQSAQKTGTSFRKIVDGICVSGNGTIACLNIKTGEINAKRIKQFVKTASLLRR